MGGRGSASIRNSGSTKSTAPATKYNDQGFEIENSNNPDVEFTDSHWKAMSKLTKNYFGAFEDPDLERDVRNKMYDQTDEAALDLYSKIEDGDNVTNDEYWAGIHALSDMLGVRQRRYTVWDSDMVSWDEKYTSIEQAEQWAVEHDGATYIYDTWTRKYRKIGDKDWRS